MELKDITVPVGTMDKELVVTIKELYPKYDKSLHSKCKRGHEYGVQLRPEAVDALCTKFGIAKETPQKKKKPDNRSLPCRISCRLTQSEYEQLQLYIRDDGYDTMQAWLMHYVRQYIKRRMRSKK